MFFCSEKITLYTLASGRAEQDANEWWSALCKASKRAIKESGIAPEDIKGMSLDTTCCTVSRSGDDMVPMRNAIMWMDVRASEQAKRIYESGHDALKYNGYGMVSAECLPAKVVYNAVLHKYPSGTHIVVRKQNVMDILAQAQN